MDAQSSSSDDVKGLERRLSEWRPAAAGLDADGVLFAAGRASVRPGWGRIAWPVLSGFLALLAAILGANLSQERAARLELTAQLRDQKSAVAPAPSCPMDADETPSPEPPAADSYLAAHRAIAGNPDSWLAVKKEISEGPSSPDPLIWKAGSPPDVLER